jgi:hypothetical protein
MPEPTTAGVLQKEGVLSRTERLIFRTEANRTKLIAIYDQRLAEWPVRFDAFFVNTRYGKDSCHRQRCRHITTVAADPPCRVAAASYGPRSPPP